MRATTDAVQLLGGWYCKDFRVERLMRDAKITRSGRYESGPPAAIGRSFPALSPMRIHERDEDHGVAGAGIMGAGIDRLARAGYRPARFDLNQRRWTVRAARPRGSCADGAR
jgi:hypothetical protein